MRKIKDKTLQMILVIIIAFAAYKALQYWDFFESLFR